MTEVWKECKIAEGYEVSDQGRVRNAHTGKILSTNFARSSRYESVKLSIMGRQKQYYIHRLVAMAFVKNPENKDCVNHIDGNKKNNKASNLEWCTNKENTKHAISTGLIKNNFKKTDFRKIIGTNITTGDSMIFSSVNEAMNWTGAKSITCVLRGIRRTSKGWTFEYA